MSETPLIDSVTTHEFLEAAASNKPTPGGGGISALVGALAASMAEMALSFTVGNRKFADVQEEAAALLQRVNDLRLRLEGLVAADADGYNRVAAALKMPRSNDQEKKTRKAALDESMRQALEPPLEVVRTIRELAGLMDDVLRLTGAYLIGDAAVAAILLPGAARAAVLNIWANISAFDAEKQDELYRYVEESIAEIDAKSSCVHGEVENKLCPKSARGRTSA